MVTLSQLQSEAVWNAEFSPPSMVVLIDRLRAALHASAVAVGSKGDANHLRGYHRSAAWIHHSRYCTDRSYSVTESAGNRNPPNPNALCAIDITPNTRAELLAMCQRLDVAVRAGRLEKIVEWYGNRDGDQRVDGYDNIRNVLASADDSHLFHLHLSFDRTRVFEDHSDIFAVLTGTRGEKTTMRYVFDKKIGGDGRVIWTDGLHYRSQPLSSDVDKFGDAAGAGPITRVTALPQGWPLSMTINALCGVPDISEQTQLTALTSAVAAIAATLANAGDNPDLAPVINAIKASHDDLAGALAEAQTENADLRRRLADALNPS